MIAWTIAAARDCALIDEVVVSSDDAEIIAAAREAGAAVPFVRPAELARDDTPAIDVALHALDMLKPCEYLVLLQPTSPLRTAAHIEACLRLCDGAGADSAVTVTLAEPSPYWMYFVDDAGRMAPVLGDGATATATRRQDLPPAYALNGAVYVSRSASLRLARRFVDAGTLASMMPAGESLDIDTELDLITVQAIMEGKLHDIDPSSLTR